ncbi:MAG: DUF4173 domain-containing protein [Ginsengibacter sp.]
MKTEPSKLLLVIAGAVIFNIIFWNEKLGVNTILFDIFICGSVFFLFPYSLKSSSSKWLLAGHLITAAMVIIHNTVLSKISFSITMLLFISFSQYIHRSVWYAGGSAVMNYINVIPNFFHEFSSVRTAGKKRRGWSKHVRVLFIPFCIFLVFYIIYSAANSVFSQITADISLAVEKWFSHFFDWFSFQRFGFLLLGVFITSGLILRNRNTFFSDADLKQHNDLARKKNKLKKWQQSSFADLLSVIAGKSVRGIMALKNEFTTGTISLILLNLLLLFINIIDVRYVWLGFTFSRDSTMAAYVQEGAGLLILSIFLAMFLLLFFFRANLNFYKKNKWLRYGAYLWIVQNLFLVLSVFMRDYYYISHYGLAYKRIGLLFFLAMVLAGLVTVFLKIYHAKTTYYLLRLNAWVAILLLVFSSAVHWDETIAKYNLAKKSTIPLDVPFLLSLSDKTLPLLKKDIDVLEKAHDYSFRYGEQFYYTSPIKFLDYREKEFLSQQKQYTWLSWNVADAQVKKDLSQNMNISQIK